MNEVERQELVIVRRIIQNELVSLLDGDLPSTRALQEAIEKIDWLLEKSEKI